MRHLSLIAALGLAPGAARAGKTELALRELLDKALRCPLDLPLFFYVAPLLKQDRQFSIANRHEHEIHCHRWVRECLRIVALEEFSFGHACDSYIQHEHILYSV